MAQDITTRVQVLGQNSDGSLNVRMDGGNPFGGGASNSGAMTPYNPAAAANNRPRTAMIGNVEVNFATEADMLRAQMALKDIVGGSNPSVPQLVGGGADAGGSGTGGTGKWINIAANAGSAINNLFTRSNLDRKLKDYDRALQANTAARDKLTQLQSKYPDLVPVLLDVLTSERIATETAQGALEDLVSANGIAIGVDVARVANDFLSTQNNAGSIFSGGGSGALLAGGAGLAVGLLAARSNSNDRR